MSGVLRGFCLLGRSEECRLVFRHTYGDFSGTREGWKPEQSANTAPIKTARRLLADCSLIARASNPSNRRAPWSGQTRASGGSHRQFPRIFGEILVGFEPASSIVPGRNYRRRLGFFPGYLRLGTTTVIARVPCVNWQCKVVGVGLGRTAATPPKAALEEQVFDPSCIV